MAISKWMHENKWQNNEHKTLKPQIYSIVKSCYWRLWKIGQIPKYLTKDAVDKLIHAFINSRQDKGNGLLYGLPDNEIN